MARGGCARVWNCTQFSLAPIPPEDDDLWIQLALDLVGIGFAAVGGPFFSGCKYLPTCVSIFLSFQRYMPHPGGTTDG